MIRILQQDNKATKILFAVIIGAASLSMVAYLIPGIGDTMGNGDTTGIYATVREPGFFGRFGSDATPIKTAEVTQLAQQQLQRQRLPDFLLPYMMSRAGQIMVQQAILRHEADRLHLQVSDEDLRRELETGQFAQYLFPNGKYIGDEQYINFVQTYFQLSRAEFESRVKQDMELNRLQALITGGVTVSDNAVREAVLAAGTKVKFDYAVVSSEDLGKTINPSDAELQAFFKKNSARYATAIPETRKIEYVAFDASNIPGGKPTITDAEIQSYYTSHQAEYQVKEQVKTRHILITVPAGADAKTDAAAKEKAAGILKQVQSGGNFAELAKQYSDDPGSKTQGGELPMIPTSGLDPAYAKAAMALNPGQTSGLVRSQFGYHIIQTEQKDAAHTKPLAEVKDTIVPILEQQKAGAAEQAFAAQLAAEAKTQGIEKVAAAHNLHAVTTDYVAKDGVIPGLADASGLLNQAFTVIKGAPPASVSTGDGFAVFQVTDIKPAHAPEFDAYKSHILDDYRAEQLPQLLAAQLTKLEARAKALGDLKKAAEELKLHFKSSDLVGKDGQVPEIGALTGPAAVVFTLPKGAISAPITTATGGVILSVTDKQQPTPEEIAKAFDQSREQLLSQQREEIFRVYIGTLTERYEKAGAVRLTQTQKQPTPGGRGGGSPLGL